MSPIDVISACALYASKNTTNDMIIMRCIENKADDLLSSGSATGLLNCLAQTQALLLYQIMRFFDGDIVVI